MMLREDLKKSDIPGHTTMQTRIHELLDNHLSLLEWALRVCSVDILLNVANSTTIEIGLQNLIHYGYLDRFTAVAILGNNCTLD